MSLALRLREAHGLLPRDKAAPVVQSPRLQPVNAAKEKQRVKLPVVQGLAPAFSLQSMLDQYLVSLDDNVRVNVAFKFRGPRSDGVFHASEVSDEQTCRRYLAYGIYRAPRNARKVDARIQRIFDNGHFTHARLESYLIAAIEAAGGQAWNELSYPPDAKLRSGTADVGILLYGWPYLVEIKSIKTASYAALASEPAPHHRSQLNQYMGLAGVHAGFILYENKDTQDVREYFVRFSQKDWQRVEGVCDEVMGHVAQGTLPEKITVEEGCEMDQCLYHAICKKRGGERWSPPAGGSHGSR
jgi:hypothetical protein